MNKQKIQKEKLFNLFSQNLEWVKEHPSISFKPNFSNGYICPLCFEIFSKKDLNNDAENPLTLEDIPPKSLGGKPLALTCKKCNSKSGSELDIHLLNRLLEIDSRLLLPNSKRKVTYELNGNKVNGALEIDQSGTLKLDLQPKRSNPQNMKKFIYDVSPQKTIYNPFFNPNKAQVEYKTPPITIKFNNTSNERRSEVALLRIGYLLAFATLGNDFLINGNLYKVREQIQNPDKEILPPIFWIKYDFPKECEGVNIISLPKELQCFLVIFNLNTLSTTRQFAIALPGPSKPGIEIYNSIEKMFCSERKGEFLKATLEHIPQKYYLHNKDGAFVSYWYWQKYTDENYRPSSSLV